MEIVLSDSRPGDRYLLQSLMQEALLVHNEIVRRINQGVSPGDIEVSSLRHIIYFTENGMIQHIVVHYLTDLQITNLLFEVQQMYYNIVHTHGLPKEKIGLKPLSQIKFLNFRRCGQTHWIDYTNKQIRLLGLRTPLDVKGLEVLEKFPEIKVAGLRLLNKEDGYSVSIQCLIPTNILDEFSRECMISAGSEVNVEEKIKNIEVGNGDIENEENENLDYSLIEALCQKYNRDKDSDKYHNSPRFLKGVAS